MKELTSDSMNFQELDDLRRFLAWIRQVQVLSLKQYHDEKSNGFYHRYDERKEGDFSKASTATCVLSLIAAEQWTATTIWGKPESTIALAQQMLCIEWKSAGLEENNPFTVAFILESVMSLLNVIGENNQIVQDFLHKADNAARLEMAENILLESLKRGRVQLAPYPASAYLTQLAVRALKLRMQALPNEVEEAVEDWAWNEINRQLALRIVNSKTSDLFQLAYSIMLVSSLGDPGNITPDQNLILQGALDQLFEGQLADGSWPRSRPLFHYPEVGSAYCYEYEMLVQLLQEERLKEKLLRYLPQFARSARALEQTLYELKDGGFGWSSGHHSQIPGPESWSTASVYHYAHALDRLVAEAIKRSVFDYLNTPYIFTGISSVREVSKEFAPKLLDCPFAFSERRNSLRDALFELFVKPIASEALKIDRGRSFSSNTPMSAIFFGPPGTSKTELARQIADYLSWPLLMVDPSHFVRKGLDQVQAEADHIFSMLAASERVVVLLDEFDEMVRSRHHANEVLSRFLTTAMLPKLVSINKNRRIVFIVATNYIDEFDLAISRPGRFDMLVQVMPPKLEAKLRHWSSFKPSLARLKITINASEEEKLEALTYDEFRLLDQRLKSISDAQAALRMIDDTWHRCTLMSKYDPHGEDQRTWKDVCDEQREKIRLPSQS